MIEKIAIRITSILFLINLFCGFIILTINLFAIIVMDRKIINVDAIYLILSIIISILVSLIIIAISGYLDIIFNLRETKHEKSRKSK
jgi:hypothetical protein